MRKISDRICECTIRVLTIFLFVSFLLFETYTWGRYSFFLVSALILFLSAIKHGGKIRIRFGAFHFFMLAFTLFSLLSSLWALNSEDSLIMSLTLFRLLVCASFLYWHYIREPNIFELIKATMWAGYFVALYTIYFYGIKTILLATTGAATRLNNDYSNVNSIGMACALSLVIQFWGFLYKKMSWRTAIFVPTTLLVIAATQSRKALLFAVGGTFMVLLLKSSSQKNFLKNIFRVILSIILLTILLYVVVKFDLFSGISERLESMLNMFTGRGKVDSSALRRSKMISLGLKCWSQFPITGIGVANPHIISAQYLNIDTYLHNNFVELLCGGGVIGFTLYYGRYLYLFWGLWKYRNSEKEYFAVGFVWLAMMLIMDFAMVSYYSKLQNFYFMIHFLNVECLKRKSGELVYAG